MAAAIRVLIVDDSAFMRNALARMLSSDPDLAVAGTARDGVEAVELVVRLRPDVVTMDVEMPRMNGIEALRRIMATTPVPVIMVSSLTSEGARVTLQALELGAVDFIPKNLSDLAGNILKIREVLIEKVKQIGRRGMRFLGRPRSPAPPAPPPPARAPAKRLSVVVIGTSTGGPRALQEIVPCLPPDLPVPVLVAQHMPPAFTGPLAERLAQRSRIPVKEAEEGDVLRPGLVLIAPGRGHMSVARRRALDLCVTIAEGRGDLVYRPSVDVLMTSVAQHYPGRALGVILTGMGNDGEKGMREIKRTGGMTIAEDERTCVVYGMPRAVIAAGLADKILPLGEIAGEIVNSV